MTNVTIVPFCLLMHIHFYKFMFVCENNFPDVYAGENMPLTDKELGKHGCVLSIVAIDALILKHQAISIHSDD